MSWVTPYGVSSVFKQTKEKKKFHFTRNLIVPFFFFSVFTWGHSKVFREDKTKIYVKTNAKRCLPAVNEGISISALQGERGFSVLCGHRRWVQHLFPLQLPCFQWRESFPTDLFILENDQKRMGTAPSRSAAFIAGEMQCLLLVFKLLSCPIFFAFLPSL